MVEPAFDGHRETARYYDCRLTQLQSHVGYFIRLSLARKSMKVRTLAERYLRLG
jgi:hypothetical protein